ncbi:hypothetical protein GQ42DRAFT_85724 [Ramicandelaber brevisporus]|nr:hypothetical protein GQ42DRAFT_85724 [Ramicandelaber brevisporus]
MVAISCALYDVLEAEFAFDLNLATTANLTYTTMMTNDNEQPDELQQPTLPLIYLPIELAEEVSMYFEGRDAAKLLRVSRSFHSLFLPRVWNRLATFATIKDDEIKQLLLEKYGHFTRIMDFTNYTIYQFKFDWLPFVINTTHLNAVIHIGITVEMVEVLEKFIKQSKIVQILSIRFDNFRTSVKYDELAAAINGLKYLKRITCEFVKVFGSSGAEGQWMRAASFVDLLHPSVRSKLRLKMRFHTAFNEAAVQGLAPYIVQLRISGKYTCTADLADKFFCVRDNEGQPLVFPQLKEMTMISCCFKSGNHGIKSITASRLPQLQILYFYDGPCDLLDQDEIDDNKQETYDWKPEYSGYPHIIIPSQRWQYLKELRIGIVSSSILMDIIDLNPLFQKLSVGAEHSRVPKVNDASKYNNDEFQLDTILYRLPRLEYFSIERLNSRIIAEPAAIPTKRRYNIQITIGRQMSIAPSATAYILQIPQLTNLSFYECVFVDVDETIQLLQSSAATCGVKQFDWFPIEWNIDLALAIEKKIPQKK